MKKMMCRLLCLALVLSLALTLGGCGSEKKKLLGSWETTVDLTEAMNERMQVNKEMGEYLYVEDFSVKAVLTLNEDDTFTMVVDKDSVENAMIAMMDGLERGMVAYIESLLVSGGMEHYSVDDLLSALNISFADVMEETFKEMDENDEMFDYLDTQGRYLVEDGRLYMSDDLDEAVEKQVYDVYTLSDDTLTFTEHVDPDADEEEKSITDIMYPMVYNRME